SYTYASSATGVATVSGSGLVTGVALGNANMTATSGAVTSTPLTITVANTGVAAIISFGRDTLAVGRGGNTSIPILLSKPNASPVTVNLAARDTNAYFASASITIPANQTSANVTLNGRNAGTTLIYATDGGGSGYAGDTAVVQVQANLRFSSTSWSLNATDQVAAQVLLSDPSPAGGTYVTYTYGTAGKAQVSPDPAFIPAGQLASNIVITALGSTTGSTTITPVATGVNGTASTLYVSAPVLTISAGASARLGSGQFESGWYVYTPQYASVAVPLTYVSTDTNVVRVSPLVGAIPAGSYYQYFTVSGVAPGTAKVIVSAAGWTPDTLAMTVTSPRMGICCAYTLQTTSPTQTLTIYAEDSTGTVHYRTSSLATTVTSSDTTVIKVIDKNPSIPAGQYYQNGIRYQPGGAGGTAWIKVVAGGHAPDSMLVTVVGPKLEFNYCCTLQLGTGQYESGVYVYAPNNVVNALTVNLTTANAAKVSVPASVTIPAGSYYAYLTASALDTTTSTALVASAAGYQGDTMYVKVSSPKIGVCCGGTYNNFNPNPIGFTVYAQDSAGTTHYRTTPLIVALRSTDTTVIKVDSASVTIAAGQYYNNAARLRVIGLGSAYIVATSPGHRPDSTAYTVQMPKLNFNFYSTTLGRRQTSGVNSYYVYTPDTRTSPLAVTFTQKQASVASLSTSGPTIGSGTYYAYFDASGLAVGTDTVIATAPGYLPDTAFIGVSTTKFTGGGIPSTANTTNPNYTTTVYAADVNGTAHYVMDTVVLNVTSSDTTVIRPTQAKIRILPGQYYVQPSYAYTGPGSAFLTFTDSAGVYASLTSNTVTVTGPSLVFSTSSVMYGMRQQGSGTDYYVYTQNNVATPLTVNLVSTDTRVATVPATVTIPAGSYYAYFNIQAKDTVGTIQVQASASGYGPPTPMTVQVTVPKFVISTNTSARTTQGPQGITIYATDANGNAHYTTEAVKVGLTTSSAAVFTTDSSFVTIPAGVYYNNSARWLPGASGGTSAQLGAYDCTGVASGCPPTTRSAIYAYNTASANLSVTTPGLYFSWSTVNLGLGQYIDQGHFCCYYVYTYDNLAAGGTVSLGHAGAAKTSVPATTSIPAGSYYSYFKITGTAVGTDTLTAALASPLHNGATAYVVVDSGRIVLPGWTPAAVGDSVLVTLQTRDPSASSQMTVAAATTFTLSSAGGKVQFRLGGAVVTSVTVPTDGNQVQFYVKSLGSGSDTITITSANYKTYTSPVTVP
ncbi:MAG: Ig-like domain-containing protein, partial [Gemmatimonadota bacterium]|nr:Ig-like domain-containing protein [Gemmatimonadota bacterium]